jgi:CheY-like chemotaxis protein
MNGLEASKTIRTTIPIEYQPQSIIALTANALQDNR